MIPTNFTRAANLMKKKIKKERIKRMITRPSPLMKSSQRLPLSKLLKPVLPTNPSKLTLMEMLKNR